MAHVALDVHRCRPAKRLLLRIGALRADWGIHVEGDVSHEYGERERKILPDYYCKNRAKFSCSQVFARRNQ
jgi:hypothetical protein